MPSYTLELEIFSLLNGSASDFEIWTDGILDSTHTISSLGTIISTTISYGGALPSSLEFRFSDTDTGTVDEIEIRSAKINEKYVNTGNYLSTKTLNDGGVAVVDIDDTITTDSDYIFDASEPDAADFLPATRTFTTGNDTIRLYNSATPETFDMLDGRDVAYLGSGAYSVNGGLGNDYIRGGGGNDLLFGGDGNDRLFGEDGDDTLYGGNGDDRIHGGVGKDEIHGGAGADRLNGQGGDDVITGGAGSDKLNGGAGNDFLFGGADNDTLVGAAGNDTLDGGAGDDLVYGGAGADQINGGDGIDSLFGGLGNDIIHGDDGNDELYGDDGNDTLYGGNNDDFLHGGDGTDTLHGGAGVDVLIGAAGADTLYGGAGNDVLHGHGLNLNTIYLILQANPTVVFNFDTNSFYEYVNSSTNSTSATAAANASTLNGVAGHLANITSATENAYVSSIIGNDVWLGGSDASTEGLWVWEDGAEAGISFSSGSTAINNMYVDWAAGQPDDATGGGQDHVAMTLAGGWEDHHANRRYVIEWDAGLMSDDLAIDTLNGGDGNDFLYGYGGNDILSGDAGDDVLIGGTGNDTLYGGTGVDSLYGGAGADTIYGGDAAGGGTIAATTLSSIITADSPHAYWQLNETLGTTADNQGSIGAAVDGTLQNGVLVNQKSLYQGGSSSMYFDGINDYISVTDNTQINTSAHEVRTIELVFNADTTAGRQVLWEEGATVNALTIYIDAGNIHFNIRDNGEYGPFNISTPINAGETYHVAAVFDSITDNSFVGYLNGAIVGSGVTSTDLDAHSGDIGIAAQNGGNFYHDGADSGALKNHFTGFMSDVALYNSVLSAADVQERADIVSGYQPGAAGAIGNFIYGGDGLDILYGSEGRDSFVFESVSAFNDVDIINSYDYFERDAIDISDLLIGYTSGVSDINDFVQISQVSGNSFIAVDADGATGGSVYLDVVEINGEINLNPDAMLSNGNLIA